MHFPLTTKNVSKPTAFASLILIPFLALAAPRSPAKVDMPAGLKQAFDNARYAIEPATQNTQRADNPANSFSVQFNGAETIIDTGKGGTPAKLHVSQFGWGSALHPAGPVTHVDSLGKRLNRQYGSALSEWFENTPQGLEQGFVLAQREQSAAGPLRIQLTAAGGWHVQQSAQGVRLTRGTVTLDYAGLHAWDARGTALSSHLRAAAADSIEIEVDDAHAAYPLTVDPTYTQQAQLADPGGSAYDSFGLSAALSSDGNTALLGASGAGTGPGAAYVFTRSGTTWTLLAKLTSGSPVADYFGFSVALSGDGSTALVGAYGVSSYQGAAYVFTGPGWTTQQKLTAALGASNDNFGFSVALSSDGSTALVGAYGVKSGQGAAYVFTGSGWGQQQPLTAAGGANNDFFGISVALSSDGSTALVGATNVVTGGAAYVFTGSGWSAQQKLTDPGGASRDLFGNSVALSSDGGTALVGAPGVNSDHGAAYVFTSTGWSQQQALLDPGGVKDDDFGSSVALSGDGSTALVGALYENSHYGAAYAYTGSGWSQQQQLTATGGAPNGQFGSSVALSSDGSTALVGAEYADSYQGAAYVFTLPPTAVLVISKSHTGNFTQGALATWTIQVTNTASNVSGATDGTAVTVQDTLPAGYTLASSPDAAWHCSGTTIVTCTNNEVVSGGGGTFSPLTLIANVPANSPTSITNNVLVYGGGDLTHTNATNAATAFDTATVVPPTQSVTITVPAGISFTLNSTPYKGTNAVSLPPGQYTLSTALIQPLATGSQIVFASWSDSGPASHSITVGSSPVTITGTFNTQYQLTTAAGAGGTVTPASGTYYNSGTVVPVTATPNANYGFVSWTGPVASTSTASTSVTMTAPASISASFKGLNAVTYGGLNTTTKGTWTGNYGADGYIIANDANLPPSYAKVSLTNDSVWTWALPTTDPRALQTAPGATTRIASTFYSTSTVFNINVNITDNNAHRISLYVLDWDTTARAQTITIMDATTQAVLDTETFASFQNGEYASWTVSGNIIFQVTRTAGYNSVVAGIFFDPSATSPTPPPPPPPPTTGATAAYAGPDAVTHGVWTPTYGADGDYIANYAANNPSYGTVSFSGQSLWTWANPTTDPRALHTTGSQGIASTYYGSTFSINVNLTDGNKHRVALYLLDWDTTARAETIQIMDAATNTVLDTEKFSNFHNGVYAVWDIKGDVLIQVTGTAGYNGVVAGIFFGPASAPVTSVNSATYTGSDATTEGTWTGHYGSNGALIVNGANTLPAYAKTSLTGNATWTFASSTSDPRALQIASGSASQTAAVYYSTASSFNINLNLSDAKAHKVSLYLLDWDTTTRAETITILDAASNTVLNTQSFSAFHSGEYASWTITGNVIIQVTKTAGINSVISGIFID